MTALTACTVGPNYRPPQPQLPATFSQTVSDIAATQPAAAQPAAPPDLSRWWTTFGDPVLDTLIDRAVRSNLDLRLAEARLREARAQRGVVGADQWPGVNANGQYQRSRRSENVSAAGGRFGGPLEQDFFQVGFDASWEFDLFGRMRRNLEAADADVTAAQENQRDVLVALLAEVARNYAELRSAQQRLTIARDNIEAQRQSLDLVRARLAGGVGTDLEAAQAQALLSSTQAQAPLLEASLKQSAHRISVLLGQAPAALWPQLSADRPLPASPPQVPLGLPAELLRRRPDLRRAERELAAATARIGVATADLYPRIAVSGTLSLQSEDAANLFAAPSHAGSLGPSLRWPVFDAGRIRANIAVQDARQEQALARYEKAVLAALEDVENALVLRAKEQARRQSLAEAVDAGRRAVETANMLYGRGLTSYLNVLDSQRALLANQDALAQSDRALMVNTVALYKALGGGW